MCQWASDIQSMNISKKDNRENEQKRKLINGVKGYLEEKNGWNNPNKK